MSPVLVCGSAAIDFIGTYAGSFKDYQSRYPIDGLNISLQLKTLQTSFGGCGMNITYGLHRLGVPVLPLTSVGADFLDHYQKHLDRLGIDSRYICVDSDYEQSAHCIIFSDDSGNQITAFNPGASVSPNRILPNRIDGIENIKIAMLAPEDAPIMLRQARDLAKFNAQVIFDPGQGIAEFSEAEVRELLEHSDSVICNAHEWEIMQTNAAISSEEIIATHQVVITRGANGVDVYRHNEPTIHIEAVHTDKILDPTGCGDAFRAGFIFGRLEGLDVTRCAQLGCAMASINIQYKETQQYEVDRDKLLKLVSQYDAGPA